MPMHIAMIGQKGLPARFGGVERHVEELALRLSERGLFVTVYARAWYTQGATASHPATLRVVHLPSLRTKHFDTFTHTLFATLHAIRSSATVIHYHGVGPSLWSFLPRLIKPEITVITTFHSLDRKHEKWGPLSRLALRLGEWTACRLAHKTIAVSGTLKQYIRDVYNRDALFIPNAVPNYLPATATTHMARFGLKPKKYFLAVSRLIRHKGAHYLIAAYNHISENNPHGDIPKLVIVGDGHYTKSYVRGLHRLAANNPNIIFTGTQSGDVLAELFSHALALIHPSDKEGLPMTVLEGMSYGLPIIVSDIPEHLALIPQISCIFAQGNVTALTERLLWLAKEDHAVLKKIGDENRARARRDYDWDSAINQIMVAYHTAKTPEHHCNPFANATISSLPSKFTSRAATSTPGAPSDV